MGDHGTAIGIEHYDELTAMSLKNVGHHRPDLLRSRRVVFVGEPSTSPIPLTMNSAFDISLDGGRVKSMQLPIVECHYELIFISLHRPLALYRLQKKSIRHDKC